MVCIYYAEIEYQSIQHGDAINQTIIENIFMKKLLFIILPIICSCGSSIKKNSLPDDIFNNAIKLDYVWEKTMDYSLNVWIHSDSLLIKKNKDGYKSGYLLDICTINSDKPIYGYLPYGASTGECLASIDSFIGDTILIYEFIKHEVYILDLNCLPKKVESKSTNIVTQNMIPFGDRLLCQNPHCFKELHNYRNNGKRFILSDPSYNYFEKKKYNYNTFNVTRGYFLINWKKNRIFYADAYRNTIEIYDTNLSLLRITFGPENQKPQYTIIDKDIIFYGDIPNTYTSLTATDDYVYAAYSGNKICNDRDRENFISYILVFDWSGNYIVSFEVDMYIKTLSLSADKESVFAYGQISNSEYRFRKYTISNFLKSRL